MTRLSKLKEWRSVEIVKLFLLNLDMKLIIQDSPTDLFDLIVSLEEDPRVRFAIEVKSKQKFKSEINKQIDVLTGYRDQRLITVPVLIIKVDDVKEVGEIDFLVFPSFKEKKLLVRYTFKFSELNKANFAKKLSTIIKWYTKLPEFTGKEKEQFRRSITEEDLQKLAETEIGNSYKGSAIVSHIEIVGIRQEILENWLINDDSALTTLFKLRNYLDFAITKAQTVQMYDYDGTSLIEEVEYPSVTQHSDIFIFILPIDKSNNQRKLASIFSVMATCLEIWRLAINNQYTIRGSIHLGDIFFDANKSVIIGDALENISELHKLSEYRFRVIFSNEIKSLINLSLNEVNPAMIDYYRRFIFKDIDGWLALNPALALANNPDLANKSINKIKMMVSKIKNRTILERYDQLIKKVQNQDIDLQDKSIFY